MHIKSQVDLQYFSFNATGERKHNGLIALDLQSEPVFSFLVATLNTAIDFYQKHFLMGFGLEAFITDRLHFLSEYSPNLYPSSGNTDSYSFGLKMIVGGHQFLLYFGNSTHIGARRFMSGSEQRALHFGFTIQRLFFL